jgi:uncharacterized membrane protein YfcA
MEQVALLAAIGCVSGFLAGLLGIGGGVIIVPGLLIVLPQLGVTGPDLVKVAMATSLAVTLPISISGVQEHIVKRAIDWVAFQRLGLGIMSGSFAGSQLSASVNDKLLTMLFIAFVLYGAWSMLRGRKTAAAFHPPLPGTLELALKGFGIGAFSAMAGIGGALLTVPLLAVHLPMPRAIATTAALGIPLAAAATFGYGLAAEPAGTCALGCAGYIYLPGAGAIATAAILTAPVGAYFTHAVPTQLLRRVFAAMMIVIAANLIWKMLPQAQQAAATDARAAEMPNWLK